MQAETTMRRCSLKNYRCSGIAAASSIECKRRNRKRLGAQLPKRCSRSSDLSTTSYAGNQRQQRNETRKDGRQRWRAAEAQARVGGWVDGRVDEALTGPSLVPVRWYHHSRKKAWRQLRRE